MDINYHFIPEFKAREECIKKIVESIAGRLLEVTDSRLAVIYLDEDDKPVVLHSNGRLINFFDCSLIED